MQNREFLLKCTAFLYLGLALQVYQLNAKSLVQLQGGFFDLKTMEPSKTIATTTPSRSAKSDVSQAAGTPPTPPSDEIKSPPIPGPSESTFTDYVSTQEGEVTISPTEDSLPSVDAPCWKKRKEMMDYFSMFKMLGLPQDFTPPLCDAEGYYKPRQCNFAGCHCVDKEGNPTSDFNPYFGTLVCPEMKDVLNDSPSP